LSVSLRLRFILASVAALGSVMVAGAWHFSRLQSEALEAEARNRAELVLSFSEACRDYTKRSLRPAVDALTDEMILEAKSSTFVTKGILKAMGESVPGYSYRQPTTNPLNPDDRADPFEEGLLQQFRADRDLQELDGYRTSGGVERYYVARPTVVEQSCLACHGDPEQAPSAVVNTYGKENGYQWRVGEIASAVLISIPTDDLRSQQASMMQTMGTAFTVMTLLMVIVTYVLFGRLVNGRVLAAVSVMDRVATDPICGARIRDRGKDELGAMAAAFDAMADSLADSHCHMELKVSQRTSDLASAEARLRAILECASEAIMVTDREGIVEYVNPAYTALTGYTSAEVVGRQSNRTTSGVQPKDFYLEMWSTINAGRTWEGDLVNCRKDGSLYDSHLTIAPISGADLQGPAFVAVQRDVTAQKELQAQLRSAREAAESTAEAKSNFLANMSHEIRTPMNGIIGMTELALDTDLDDSQRTDLETIHACAESLQVLLNDILDFSKIEAGKMDLEAIDFDVEALLKGVVDILSQPAAAKDLELAAATGPDVPGRLRGDPGRLRQVLLNLGTNAIKFTSEGAVRITTEVLNSEGEQHRLRFSVSDTGIGIPEDRQARIFDEFVQADSSTTREHGGTGLGLAISKRIVELMSGELQVESTSGAGSTFSFTVALPRGTEAATEQASSGEQPHGPAPVVRDRLLRVLLVEDNPVNQRVAQRMLRRAGCQVTCAENGRIALEILGDEGFDLVFMDVQMPEMDGLECTRAIRSSGQEHLPIIAMTAHAMKEDRERCLAAGMSDYLSKPVRAEELCRLIERWSPGAEPPAAST
jgi:PAS domain S-box-containing protein